MTKKKLLIGAIVAISLVGVITACGKKVNSEDAKAEMESNSQINIEESMHDADISADTDTEYIVEETIEDDADDETVITVATFVEHQKEDNRLLFSSNEIGDFVIFEDNIDPARTPETFIEGQTYAIEHSKMMTMSIPAQIPQVFSIVEVSADKETAENTDVASIEDEDIVEEVNIEETK